MIAEIDIGFWIAVFAGTLRAATPLIFAGLGELLYEKAGVLNLGLEGLMLLGACAAVSASVAGMPIVPALAVGMMAGAAGGLLHALLCVQCRTNQAVTGLAILFLLQGMTAVFGRNMVGQPVMGSARRNVIAPTGGNSAMADFLQQLDPLFPVAVFLAIAAWWFLTKTRQGIAWRSCGEEEEVAHNAGFPVKRIRMLAGGACGLFCGLAGGHFALIIAQQWQENMISGRGWIALVLVIFAKWHPLWLISGACLFGGLTALQLNLQTRGFSHAQYLLSMLPFVITIIALAWTSWRLKSHPGWMPREIGRHASSNGAATT